LGTGMVPLSAKAQDTILASLRPHLSDLAFRQRIPRENSIIAYATSDALWETHNPVDVAGIRPGTPAQLLPPHSNAEPDAEYESSGQVPMADKLAEIFPVKALRPSGSTSLVIVGPGLAKLVAEAKREHWIQDEAIQIVIEDSQPDRDVFVVAGLDKPIERIEDLDPQCLARITLGYSGYSLDHHTEPKELQDARAARHVGGVRLSSLEAE